jgi:hypothetical protein
MSEVELLLFSCMSEEVQIVAGPNRVSNQFPFKWDIDAHRGPFITLRVHPTPGVFLKGSRSIHRGKIADRV